MKMQSLLCCLYGEVKMCGYQSEIVHASLTTHQKTGA